MSLFSKKGFISSAAVVLSRTVIMRLKDYKIYLATFEPCQVQGSKEGFRAIVHAQDLDIVTYGVDFENTVKMSQAVVTDMAHAMSYEEIIPAALPITKLNVPQEFIERSKQSFLKAKEQHAQAVMENNALAQAQAQGLTKAEDSDSPSNIKEGEHYKLTSFNASATKESDNTGLAVGSSVTLSTTDDYCSADVKEYLQKLSKDNSTATEVKKLAEPDYVKDNAAPTLTVPIELPTETAYKIIIANQIMKTKASMNELARILGWQKSELEQRLDFYAQTNIFDLKLILNKLGIKLEDPEPVL